MCGVICKKYIFLKCITIIYYNVRSYYTFTFDGAQSALVCIGSQSRRTSYTLYITESNLIFMYSNIYAFRLLINLYLCDQLIWLFCERNKYVYRFVNMFVLKM